MSRASGVPAGMTPAMSCPPTLLRYASRYSSAIVCLSATSVITAQCHDCWLDPLGACSPMSRQLRISSRSTGASTSNDRRADRVVVSSCSTSMSLPPELRSRRTLRRTRYLVNIAGPAQPCLRRDLTGGGGVSLTPIEPGLYSGTDIWSDGWRRWPVTEGADADRLYDLGMFATAFAGRPVAVDEQLPGDPPWTDGQTVFIDTSAPFRANLEAIAVQASMIAAGSLDPDVVRPLARHSRLARRYLAIEGHRALVANAAVLPRVLTSLGDPHVASRSNSPTGSLSLASGTAAIDDPPPEFGVIRANKVLAACARAARQTVQEKPGHVPRSQRGQELADLDDGEVDDSDDPDLFTSPIGGGGFIGKWLKKMLSSARKTGSGGGPPGADTPTHRINAANRGAHAVSSLASAASEEVIDHAAEVSSRGVKYPE